MPEIISNQYGFSQLAVIAHDEVRKVKSALVGFGFFTARKKIDELD